MSERIRFGIDNEGVRRLWHAVLIAAIRDTLEGDKEAWFWLADVGADLAYRLGIVNDPDQVRAWVDNPTLPEFMTMRDVATRAGCSPNCVSQAVARGEMPRLVSLLHARKLWFIPEDVERWIEYRAWCDL